MYGIGGFGGIDSMFGGSRGMGGSIKDMNMSWSQPGAEDAGNGMVLNGGGLDAVASLKKTSDLETQYDPRSMQGGWGD
jgi:hypothetical protein